MSQHYSDPSRESDPHALPDVEVFQEDVMECEHCAAIFPDFAENPLTCPDCGKRTRAAAIERQKWFYWYCFPGCLPDSDPVGPFESEEAALADAREGVE